MIAALYVDPRGPYASMPDVDPWDEKRDARTYAGPWPVVAHPPCGPWGRLAHMCRRPQDRELAIVAVEQVRRWGGVLEHPEGSRLFSHMGLPVPNGFPDAFGGRTIRVNQVEWGHACVKPTFLYMVGVYPSCVDGPFPGRKPTHGIWYGAFERSGHRGPVLLGASKEIRRRTPPAFARWLVDLAHTVTPR